MYSLSEQSSSLVCPIHPVRLTTFLEGHLTENNYLLECHARGVGQFRYEPSRNWSSTGQHIQQPRVEMHVWETYCQEASGQVRESSYSCPSTQEPPRGQCRC